MPNQRTRKRRYAIIEKKALQEWPLFDKWYQVVARHGVSIRVPMIFRAIFTPNLFRYQDQRECRIGLENFRNKIGEQELQEFLSKYCGENVCKEIDKMTPND